jgi:hypothetical protein
MDIVVLFFLMQLLDQILLGYPLELCFVTFVSIFLEFWIHDDNDLFYTVFLV